MEKSQEREILGAFAQFIKDVIEAGVKFIGTIVQIGLPTGQTSGRVITCEPIAFDRKGAANYIGVSPSKISELLSAGELSTVVIGGRPKYLKEELDRYVERLRRKSRKQ